MRIVQIFAIAAIASTVNASPFQDMLDSFGSSVDATSVQDALRKQEDKIKQLADDAARVDLSSLSDLDLKGRTVSDLQDQLPSLDSLKSRLAKTADSKPLADAASLPSLDLGDLRAKLRDATGLSLDKVRPHGRSLLTSLGGLLPELRVSSLLSGLRANGNPQGSLLQGLLHRNALPPAVAVEDADDSRRQESNRRDEEESDEQREDRGDRRGDNEEEEGKRHRNRDRNLRALDKKGRGKRAVEDAVDSVKEVADKAKDRTRDAADKATDHVHDAADGAKDMVKDARDKVGGVAGKVGKKSVGKKVGKKNVKAAKKAGDKVKKIAKGRD